MDYLKMLLPCTRQMDPRVRRTRKLLQEALHSLIVEKGLSAISIKDIAERAGVNRATFYAHFADKEELAASTIKDNLSAALHQRFSELPALSNESLVELAIVVFEFLADTHDACPKTAAQLQNTIGMTVQSALYEVIDVWLSSDDACKRLFPGREQQSVATVLSWSFYGAADSWSRSDNRPPARKTCRQIVSIIVPETR